jgi:hypothetical protein
MITATQAQQYLDAALGVGVPSFLIDAAVSKVAAAESSMIASGYSAADQTLIQCYAVAIIAAAGSPRRLNSQSAPSGAGRSFKNEDGALSALRRSLAALDTAQTVTALIGPDPSAATLFMVV